MAYRKCKNSQPDLPTNRLKTRSFEGASFLVYDAVYIDIYVQTFGWVCFLNLRLVCEECLCVKLKCWRPVFIQRLHKVDRSEKNWPILWSVL
jgi:hypothetical protein